MKDVLTSFPPDTQRPQFQSFDSLCADDSACNDSFHRLIASDLVQIKLKVLSCVSITGTILDRQSSIGSTSSLLSGLRTVNHNVRSFAAPTLYRPTVSALNLNVSPASCETSVTALTSLLNERPSTSNVRESSSLVSCRRMR